MLSWHWAAQPAALTSPSTLPRVTHYPLRRSLSFSLSLRPHFPLSPLPVASTSITSPSVHAPPLSGALRKAQSRGGRVYNAPQPLVSEVEESAVRVLVCGYAVYKCIIENTHEKKRSVKPSFRNSRDDRLNFIGHTVPRYQ